MKLSTVRVLVGDFPAAFAFWRDVVQLPVAYGPETPGALPDYAYFTAGDVGLELMTRDGFATALGMPAPASAPTGPRLVVTLKVDDVAATYADLVARGATSVATPRDRPEWMARTAHLSDLDGSIIEIYSMLPTPDAPTA